MKATQSWAGYSSWLPWLGLAPGLICFAIFLLFPLGYTTYLAFQKMQTGHWLDHAQVRELLLQEEIVDDNRVYPFAIKCARRTCQIEIAHDSFLWRAHFLLDDRQDQIINLSEKKDQAAIEPANLQAVSPAEIAGQLTALKKTTFLTPEGVHLRVFRSDLIAAVSQRFEAAGEYRLLEPATGEIFVADLSQGRYLSQGQSLAPGFSYYAGFENFKRLFFRADQWRALANITQWTFVWAVLSVLLALVVGGSFALLLQRELGPWKLFLRALLIIPYAVPFFISVLIFKSLLNRDFGLVNDVLKIAGWTPLDWLNNPLWAKTSCLLVNTWLGYPYMFLVITGILQSIPKSQYEAAAIENASRVTVFWRITWPQLLKALGPTLIGTFAFNMNNFVGIYLLTGGGPPMAGTTTIAGSTDILLSYTYRLAFEGGGGQDFGLASAISILIFGIIAILTWLQLRILGARVSL